ncbi:MAG: HEPN domain-containing protein [Deltaproteobacteria bacterium]|jgi:HEPN domain-containing protein|nr:HEPN domain-containing protein [Deltaproteobacteria bacterium]
MNDIEQERLRKVRKWLSYADEDLRFAQHGLKLTTSVPYRLIAYHAQQCVEKGLKAYLVYKGIDFPYTHNISRLLELCAEYAAWTEQIEDAEELTPYAITTRYPGEDDEVTDEETSRAIGIAIHVKQVIRDALVQEGLTIPDKKED